MRLVRIRLAQHNPCTQHLRNPCTLFFFFVYVLSHVSEKEDTYTSTPPPPLAAPVHTPNAHFHWLLVRERHGLLKEHDGPRGSQRLLLLTCSLVRQVSSLVRFRKANGQEGACVCVIFVWCIVVLRHTHGAYSSIRNTYSKRVAYISVYKLGSGGGGGGGNDL